MISDLLKRLPVDYPLISLAASALAGFLTGIPTIFLINDRLLKLSVSMTLRGHPYSSEIIVRNIGKAPICICYWELETRNRFFFWKREIISSADEEMNCFLDGQQLFRLNHDDIDFFIRNYLKKSDAIYLKLSIAGRKFKKSARIYPF